MLHFDIKVDKQLRMKGLTNSDVVLLKDAIEEVSRSEKSKARIWASIDYMLILIFHT